MQRVAYRKHCPQSIDEQAVEVSAARGRSRGDAIRQDRFARHASDRAGRFEAESSPLEEQASANDARLPAALPGHRLGHYSIHPPTQPMVQRRISIGEDDPKNSDIRPEIYEDSRKLPESVRQAAGNGWPFIKKMVDAKDDEAHYAYKTWEAAFNEADRQAKAEQELEIKSKTEMENEGSSEQNTSQPPPPPPMGDVPVISIAKAGTEKPGEKEVQIYKTCRERGLKCLNDLSQMKKLGELPPKEANKRNELFDKMYTSKPSDENQYPGHLESELMGDKGGTYTNLFEGSRMTAEANRHRDPERFKPLLSNSEILYQQHKLQQKTKKLEPLKSLKRSHVGSATGDAVLKRIRYDNEGDIDKTLSIKEDHALALLGTENGTAAQWLIKDHGKELGICGITSVNIQTKDRMIEFFFARVDD